MKPLVVMAALALLLPSPVLAKSKQQVGAQVDPKAPCYRWPATDMDGDGVFDRTDHCPNTPKGCTVDQYGCSRDADGDGVCDGMDQCPNTAHGVRVNARGCPRGASAAVASVTPGPARRPARPMGAMEKELVTTGRIRLENVYFETANSKLLPASGPTLQELGTTLEKYPDLHIEIQGHTDTRGWARYNKRLSQARAEAVRSYLLEHFELHPGSLIPRGYGETRPETAERTGEELLRNRRVVLRVINPEILPRSIRVEAMR